MSQMTIEPLPSPKSPPHASPPPPHSPPAHGLPVPPAGLTASATHGAGYELAGQKSKHRPVYRVGSSQPGSKLTTTGNEQEVLALLQQYLAQHAQAVAASPGSPAPPSTFNITATAEPEGASTGISDTTGASVAFRIPHGGPVPASPHLPPYKGAHGAG